MKTRCLVLGAAALALLLAVPAALSSSAGGEGAAVQRLPRAAAAGQLSLYGHIRALSRTRPRHYRLRFDPALWLSGVTANRAAEEDKVIAPGEGVPNDYYIRDEGEKLLTYRVSPDAKVSVLDRRLRPFSISVAELAAVVRGRNPTGRPLFDRARTLGYWILVDGDRVLALDQQYQP